MYPNDLPFKLVGIAGGLNSGKGVAAGLFKSNGFMERNFSDPLKRMVRDLFNIPTKALWGPSYNRTPEVRTMLQELGDYARKYRPEIWVDKMEESLAAFAESGLGGYKGIVIADIRFAKEVDFVHEMGGVVLHLVRPGNTAGLPEELAEHLSETELKSLPADAFDFTIVNDGTLEELRAEICSIIKSLITEDKC
jgi:hypothetical protein